MGLDMYLHKRKFKDKDNYEELVYWRKANAVRAFFERTLPNFESNGTTRVRKENLEELVDLCQRVLANHDLAPKLLPTQEGFFFGGTDYDEWYFKDLKSTIENVQPVIDSYKDIIDDGYKIEYTEWW